MQRIKIASGIRSSHVDGYHWTPIDSRRANRSSEFTCSPPVVHAPRRFGCDVAMTAAGIAGLVFDLRAEHQVIVELLTPLPEAVWDVVTPSQPWIVRDQIVHLAFFDGMARLAIDDPAGFERYRDSIGDRQQYIDSVSDLGSGKSGDELLHWWHGEVDGLADAALRAEPTMRVPWYDSTMSLASKITARLMETWAHGQDVVDALHLQRVATSRLKHIARLGVHALGYSFVVHGLSVPDEPILVEVTAPDTAEIWRWGESTAANVVRGSALDFCLVVTQRRHVADTSLLVQGETAKAWMGVAQAFAGPPGFGRARGMFPKDS